MFGVEVRSLTWLFSSPIQYVWTLGESGNVIYGEVSQEKRETWVKEHIGDRMWTKRAQDV